MLKTQYASDPAKFEEIMAKVQKEVVESTAEVVIPVTETAPTSTPNVLPSSVQSLSAEIAAEMTKLRTNPASYIELLKSHLEKDYSDEMTYRSSREENLYIKTKEGKPAVQEAIKVLESMVSDTSKTLGGITASPILEKAASDHVVDSNTHCLTGHDGSDGSAPQDRINRYGQWKGSCGENVDYGNTDAFRIVMHLLIDDGVPNRGHRTNLLNPDFNLVGSCVGPHPTYGFCCVMNLAGDIMDINQVVNQDITLKDLECMTEDVMNILKSMPVDVTAVQAEIEEEMKSGHIFTMIYTPSQSKCELQFKKGNAIKTKTLGWHSASA